MNRSDLYFATDWANWTYENLTVNITDPENEAWQKWTELIQDRAVVVSLLLLFSLCTVFGNTLVIMAVVRERYLHTPTNYFITSLAVADCLVGLVVMPFSALYEVLGHTWFFGPDWCDIWRSLDVLFSTASILNLCVISLDRYWAITDPIAYPMRMTRLRSVVLIAAVWVCSSAISFPAIVWWRAVRTEPIPKYKCPFTEHLGYLIFSSTISFYLPLFVMVFTYYRIYRAAVAQTKSLRLGTKQILIGAGELELTLRIHRGGTCKTPQNENRSLYSTAEDEPLTALANNGLNRIPSTRLGTHSKNFSLSRKLAKFAKEKKAAKTLGIVMGVFIVCWLPFFVVNLLSGFCLQCIWHEKIILAVVTWLGWINSSMNPVIYACWSRDFRRYLGTGDSLKTISFSYRLGHSTVYKIFMETCRIITDTFMSEMLPTPCEAMWKYVANNFNDLWNFPNCLGAMDRKHITIEAPSNSGSLFFNYKKTFSVVLLALVDAQYNFIAVDIGAYAKNSDGGIFANSNFGKALQSDSLSVPQNDVLLGTNTKVPYVIVADEALPLKTYLMRPYPGQDLDNEKRIFNYRLCRARRISENTFGILTQKFRIYNRRIQACPENVDYIILTTCILHNFIKKYDGQSNIFEQQTQIIDTKEKQLHNLPLQGGNATAEAFRVRELFKQYFSSDAGKVPWQEDRI